MNLTEAVKEVLDRECAETTRADDALMDDCPPGCVSYRFTIEDNERIRKFDSLNCWTCHKHDALAARIADRVEFERVEVSR